MTLIEPTAGRGALDDWSSIDWPAGSRSAKLLAIRRVTQINRGSVVCPGPSSRLAMFFAGL